MDHINFNAGMARTHTYIHQHKSNVCRNQIKSKKEPHLKQIKHTHTLILAATETGYHLLKKENFRSMYVN